MPRPYSDAVPEVPLDFPRLWAEIPDPDDDSHLLRADLTWLSSSWGCIFGRGCHGIYSDRPDDGCCTLGAHFSGPDDERRVRVGVGQLARDDWQLRRRSWTATDEDGARTTRVVDGACVFLNRPGFAAGPGCALHAMALRTGRHPLETKPDVCWQLPLRRTYDKVIRPDGTALELTVLGEYDRRGWGPGGHDLDWWCTGSTEAHVSAEPVYLTYAGELRELLGTRLAEALTAACAARVRLRHPASRPPAGRVPRGAGAAPKA